MEKIIKQEKKSVKPYYGVSLLWIIAALAFPMHKAITYIVLAVASVTIYFGLTKFLPKEYEEVVVHESETGNPEYDAMLKNARELLTSLSQSINTISEEDVKGSFKSILRSATGTIEHLTKHPNQIADCRKFFTYYLPTVVKVAKTYSHYDSLSTKEDTINDTLADINKSLPMLVNTFSKIFDSLFTEQNIDISSDLSAFETISNLDTNIEKGVSIYDK